MKNISLIGLSAMITIGSMTFAEAASCKFQSKQEFQEYLASANYYQNNWSGWKTRIQFSGTASKPKMSLKRVGPDGRKYKKVFATDVEIQSGDTLKYTNETNQTYWLYLNPRCQLSFSGNNHPISRH